MQTKIIFILLFMLSFTIMHDTAINILDDKDELHISEYIDCKSETHEYTDVHDMHNIFHFIALSTTIITYEVSLKKAKTFSHNLLCYSPPHLKNSHKPPIA